MYFLEFQSVGAFSRPHHAVDDILQCQIGTDSLGIKPKGFLSVLLGVVQLVPGRNRYTGVFPVSHFLQIRYFFLRFRQ